MNSKGHLPHGHHTTRVLFFPIAILLSWVLGSWRLVSWTEGMICGGQLSLSGELTKHDYPRDLNDGNLLNIAQCHVQGVDNSALTRSVDCIQ